ncbi:MAG: hypothetical protein ACKVOM_10995 [Ferruginibacter sp.]
MIKREDDINSLRGDIHLQIFFDQRRKAKDEWLASRMIDIEEAGIDELFDKMLARCYRNSVYVVGWIDKPTLIAEIEKLNLADRTWSFKDSQRLFWNCKITASNKPATLPVFIKGL